MAIINKDIIQSYILTTAKYDFSVYEKRIIYRLVEMAQHELQGIRFADHCYKIEHGLAGHVEITLPIASLLNGEEDKHYTRVKKALESLHRKVIKYEDEQVFEGFSVIMSYRVLKRSSVVSFLVHPRIWDCILDFSKGYRKYELEAAMRFKSQYSMRFYELMSHQKTPLTYSIDELKAMFQVTEKYSCIGGFLCYVVDAAKKELDALSPYTFEYVPLKTGRKITALKFYPIVQPEHRDRDLETQDLKKQVSLSWSLSSDIRSYLKDAIGYSDREIKNNLEIFRSAQAVFPNLLGELIVLNAKSRDKDNCKGYIINALKGKVNDHCKYTA